MLAVFAIAGVSTVAEFGAISLAIAGIVAMLLLCRGLLGTPIALLSGDPERLIVETRHALALAGCIGTVGGAIIAALAPLSSDPLTILMIAGVAPVVLIQDSARYGCISSGRAHVAVLSDGVWALGSAALFVLAGWVVPEVPPRAVIGGWIALAALSAVIILAVASFRPAIKGMVAWIRSTAAHRFRFGATTAIGATNGLVFLFVVAALIGSPAIAALRGAGSVMGPISILLASMTLVAVPESPTPARCHAGRVLALDGQSGWCVVPDPPGCGGRVVRGP